MNGRYRLDAALKRRIKRQGWLIDSDARLLTGLTVDERRSLAEILPGQYLQWPSAIKCCSAIIETIQRTASAYEHFFIDHVTPGSLTAVATRFSGSVAHGTPLNPADDEKSGVR
jgi:hypothetical protein